MSRRVFDVGLDISRIKNGLKVNRESKRIKNNRSGSTSYIDDSPLPNQQLAIIPHSQHKKSKSDDGVLGDDNKCQNDETVVLPSPDSPEPAIHGEFPLPPLHHSSSPTNGEFSYQKSGLNHRISIGNLSNNFDLRPPPPNRPVKFLDTLSEQLFSGDHLNVILGDPTFFLRFTTFLNRYKPHSAPVLVQYLEAQKAMKAVEYANALAHTMKPLPGDSSNQAPCPAASIDPRLESKAKTAFGMLVTEALPAYITHALVRVVTESMVREITGTTMPIMRELVGGLAEVFCLSDPSVKDNPIVYASEEFYRTTQYGRDYTIGRNCRFLQGPKTDRQCVARLSAALKSGQEICETILNYRRDGSPFMNLLMTAPLYDNRGTIRYFIGAQVDVSGLIEEGRGLDSFARCLEDRALHRQRDSDRTQETPLKKSLRILNEFGQMLSLDESSSFQPHSRSSSMHSKDNASATNRSARGTTGRRELGAKYPRRVLGNDDREEEDEQSPWTFASIGPSGKLPGVYQNYLLLRPYPSLRIVFVSPALRIPGLLQSPFLSRIGGPSHVRDGLSEAFETGTSVTAKITWHPQGRPDDETNADPSRPSSRRAPGSSNVNPYSVINPADGGSRTRYISCTPLLGSDDEVGVWMVVMVENEMITGGLVSRDMALRRYGEVPPTPSEYEKESKSKGDGVNGDDGRMYAEFLKSQGRGKSTTENGFQGGEKEGLLDGMLDGIGDG